MNGILSAYKKIQNIMTIITGITLVLIMGVILLQTFARYVIFHSLPWSEELSRYLFVVMILFGINIGISQGMMVRIDLVDSFLGKKAKQAFEYGRLVLSLAVSGVFFYSTIDMIKIGGYQVSPAMHLPMNWMYGVLFVGFLFATLSIIVKMIELHRNKSEEGD